MITPNFDFHVFICQNKRPEGAVRECCMSKGADKLLDHMKAISKELGITNIRINKSGCLDQCENGIAMVIYPQGIWYSVKTTEDIDKIVKSHILKQETVNELLI